MAKRKNNVKTKNKKQDSKLIYIPFIVLGVLIVALIGFTSFSHPVFSPSSSFSSSPAPFKFFQVNTQNYAGNDSVQVFFISWYGCPYGATDSWALYKTLSQYGNIQATPGHSISEPNIPYIPSLWFTSFKPNSSVYFHYLYMYNEYLNATPSGIPINPENGSAVIVGLQEIKDNLSYAPWIYNIIEQYEVDTPLVSSSSGLMIPLPIQHQPSHSYYDNNNWSRWNLCINRLSNTSYESGRDRTKQCIRSPKLFRKLTISVKKQ